MKSFLIFSLLFVVISSCVSKTSDSDVIAVSEKVESKENQKTIKDVFDNNYLHINSNTSQIPEKLQTFASVYKEKGMSQVLKTFCTNPAESSSVSKDPLTLESVAQSDPLFHFYVCDTLKNNYIKKRERSPKVKPIYSASQIRSHFKSANVEALKEVNVNHLIGAIRNLSKNDLIKSSEKILEVESCLPTDIYLGAGSILENHLPEENVFSVMIKVFEKGMKCGDDEYASRSAYRYSLFKISKNECDAALPALEQVSKNSNVPYLHSRAFYWKKRCLSKSETSKLEKDQALTIYRTFPLSYHGMASFLQTEGSLIEHIHTNPDPIVSFRSGNDENLNLYTELAEFFIAQNQLEVSRRFLRRIAYEYPTISTAPNYSIYLAYLMIRSQMTLDSFKVMAPVLSQNSKFKTPTTMKLFYPGWYKELVAEKSKNKNVDPALILALIRQESAFTPYARSPAGAVGLMQLMPGSARAFDRSANKRNLVDENKNVTIGVKYFAKLLDQFDNNVAMALASYNAGRLRVVDWKKRYVTDDEILFMDLIPFRETREYVASILRNWYWYQTLYSDIPEQSFVSQSNLLQINDSKKIKDLKEIVKKDSAKNNSTVIKNLSSEEVENFQVPQEEGLDSEVPAVQ